MESINSLDISVIVDNSLQIESMRASQHCEQPLSAIPEKHEETKEIQTVLTERTNAAQSQADGLTPRTIMTKNDFAQVLSQTPRTDMNTDEQSQHQS